MYEFQSLIDLTVRGQPGLYFMKGSVVAYISGAQTGPEQPIIDLGILLASRI
jgi:hypothetical protein